MSGDAGAYRYLSGHEGIVTPNDPLPIIEAAMRAYDVRWLILEKAAVVPALAPVLTGELRPAWLSQPVAVVPGTQPSFIANASLTLGVPPPAAGPEVPAGVLFAVCLSDGDPRCSP